MFFTLCLFAQSDSVAYLNSQSGGWVFRRRRVLLREIKVPNRGVVVCANAELELPGDAESGGRGRGLGLRGRIHQQQMKRRLGDAEGAGEEGCLRGRRYSRY